MGCGDAQEKLENKIMEMNIDKIEIQMERYKQMKLLIYFFKKKCKRTLGFI